jgi:hypothetical protein
MTANRRKSFRLGNPVLAQQGCNRRSILVSNAG